MRNIERFTGRGGRKIEAVSTPSNEIVPKPKRIVIYGNNWNDRITEVHTWTESWFKERGMGDAIEIRGCKVRGAINIAFYGQEEDDDPKTIPSLVIAGQKIRDAGLGGWTDFSMDSVIDRIQSLCDEHNVPLVRYEFDKDANAPVIKSGSLLLKD